MTLPYSVLLRKYMIVRESLWITRHMYIDYVSSKAPSSVEEVTIFTIHKFSWERSSTINSNRKLNRKLDMDKKSQVVHWSDKDYMATLPH